MSVFAKIFPQETITTTIRHTEMAQATTHSFEAKITSRGYHIYKNTTWVNAKDGDEVQVEIEINKDSIKVDPYARTICIKGKYFDVTKTVG